MVHNLWSHGTQLCSPPTLYDQRIAIAQEVRSARTCRLCAERKNAISPEAIQGDHDSRSSLPGEVIEAIHRITTDAGRLSRAFYDRVTAHPGFSDGHYVEMLGVLVTVVSLPLARTSVAVWQQQL